MKSRKLIKLTITVIAVMLLMFAFGLESFLFSSDGSGLVEFSVLRFAMGFMFIALLMAFASTFFFMDDASHLRSKGFDALDHQKHRNHSGLFDSSTSFQIASSASDDFYGNREGFPAHDTLQGQAVYGKF